MPTSSAYVNRLRWMVSTCCAPLVPAPTKLPKFPSPEAPMEIDPTGLPCTKTRLESWIEEEPSRCQAAREKPARNVFSTDGENTCVSCTLATCERSTLSVCWRGLAPGVWLMPSSTVYTPESVSLEEKL